MNRKIAPLAILMLVLLSALGAAGTTVLAQTTDEAKADFIMQVLANAKNSAEESLSDLAQHNITVPSSLMESYNQALNLTQEAVQLRAQGNYSYAYSVALQAMQMFGEVYGAAETLTYREGSSIEVRAENATRMRAAIERAYEFINEIEDELNSAEEKGYNVTGVREALDLARQSLANATSLLDKGDMDGAARSLADARGTLGQSTAQLQRLTNDVESVRLCGYLENANDSLNRLELRVREQLNLTEAVRNQTMEALRLAKERLQLANTSLAYGNFDDAMRELESYRYRYEVTFRYMGEEGGSVANLEQQIAELQWQAMDMERRIQALNSQSYNTTALEESLNGTRALLQNMNVTNPNEAVKNIAQVRERLEALKDSVEDAEGQLCSEQRVRVQEQIRELEGRIAQLNSTIAALKANGTNVSQLETMLQNAVRLLEQAQTRLASNAVNSAEGLVGQASAIVDNASEMARTMGGNHGTSGDNQIGGQGGQDQVGDNQSSGQGGYGEGNNGKGK